MDANKQIKTLLIALFVILSAMIYQLSTTFVEPTVSDFFVKKSVASKEHGSKDIVLVVIDDKSLEQIRWPWSRDLYVEIFDFLENKANAKVVLFDAVLTSPDPYSQNADKNFYNYLKQSKRLILGFDLCKEGVPCEVLQKNLTVEFNKKFDLNIKNQRKILPNENSYTGIMYMQPDFLKSVQKLGSVIVMDRLSDKIRDDKVIRTYSNLVYANKTYYPSLALVGYSIIKGDKDFVVTDKQIYAKNSELKINLPTEAAKNQSSYSYLKWYKPYSNKYYSHKDYSAIDILNSNRAIKNGQKPIIDPSKFQNKIVFVGGNAKSQSLNDKLGSPILIDHAGVDIQATALNNYLDNSFSKKASVITNILISIVFLAIAFLAVCLFQPLMSLTFDFALLFVYFIIYQICINHNYIINFITIFFLEILLFTFAYIYQFMIEGEKKDKIQKAMGKYLSIDVMQKVVKDIDNITLGGKKAEATIMFIDIRKFTTISENMAAEDVTVLLNEYFTTIYPIITQYKGVLNKFIGDAVLAIFEDKENHAKNAIMCAGEVLQQVKKLQQKWLTDGKPKIDIGVGINSGEVFIGNIGTQERMEYTVIGDTVNTASRIEGYNKIYKTKFLIGEQTYKLVKTIVDVIKINQVTIRGKSQKIDIYEVLRIRQ